MEDHPVFELDTHEIKDRRSPGIKTQFR